jgi:sporulation protein YlmC with PRC-barrel domain
MPKDKDKKDNNVANIEISQGTQNKTLTKDTMANMEVINSEGNRIGNVEDISFTVGNLTVTLILKTKTGESRQVAWEEIQSVGDYVVLKPPGGQQSTALVVQSQVQQNQQVQPCPTCGQPLTYIPEYQAWYCYNEKKYA